MAIGGGTTIGNVGGTSAGSTITLTTSVTANVGEFIVVRVCCDNATSSTPTITVTDSAGNTYTTDVQRVTNVSVQLGCSAAICTAPVTTQLASGGTIVAHFSATVAARCAIAHTFTGVGGLRASGTTSSEGTSAATATVTNANPVNGDLVIGAFGIESRTAPSPYDTDTTNGSWSTGEVKPAATSGTDDTRVEIVAQHKIVNATGSQTYDVTGPASDYVGLIAVYAPAVDGTATPSAITLSATIPAPTAGGGSNTTPSAIVLAVTTPAPTTTGGGTTTPSAIALVVVIPDPTVTGGGGGDGFANPTAIELAVVTPAPTTGGGSNTTPSAIVLAVTVPAPTDTGNANTTPAAIALVVVVPAPTATGGSGSTDGTATPSAIARSVVVPTPVASGSTVFVSTIRLFVSISGTPTVTSLNSDPTLPPIVDPGYSPTTGPPTVTGTVPGTTPATAYLPVGRIRLFDRTGTTLISTLEGAFDIEWQDVDNGPGVGRFKIPLLLQEGVADASLITLGQVVYCDLYDRLNVYSFIVEQYPQLRIQSQEELGQVMEVSGRGSAAILDTALCYPYDGVNAVPVRSVRSFSFASQDYVEDAAWRTSASAIAEQGDMTTYWVMTLPETTHITSAPGAWPFLPIIPYWIWGQDDNTVTGKCYFRETFVTDDPANIEIIATGDNYWTLYLDGVPILGDNENQEAWQEHRSVSMLLPAGSHTVAAVVNNVFVVGLTPVENPGGFLMAITIPRPGDTVQPEPDLMLLSDTGWHSLAYPDSEPGWTPGAIILTLIAEAQTRSQLPGVTCSFTTTHDTSGALWEQIPEFGINIGSSLLSTLDQLVKDGWVEWGMQPSGWVLDMWQPGNRGATTSVVFAAGVNLGEATYEPAHTIVNRLLVAYGKGLFVYEPAEAIASQAVWGIHEGFLTLDTADVSEATRLAAKSIAESMDTELAVTMQIEPYLTSPDRPYVNFKVGDTVTGPSEVGTPRSYEVLGLTITIDDMGDPHIGAEMNKRVMNPEENRVSLLQTLGSAVQGTAPGSRSVVFENDGPYFRTRTPSTGDIVSAQEPTPGEVVFTVPGTVNTTGTSPRWVTPYRFLVFQVVMAVTTVGSGDIIVTCLGQTFTLPAGEESILIDCELHRINADSFTVSLTDVGAGDAEGLTVTLRYRYYTGAI